MPRVSSIGGDRLRSSTLPAPAGARRSSLAAIALLAIVACTDRGPLAPPTLEPLELMADGPWFRDRAGRVVLLRGITLSPLELGRFGGGNAGPSAAEIRELERAGFNVLRVFLPWSRLMPRKGSVDHGFLAARLDPLVRRAAQHGMVVVLALHQHGLSRCFPGGVGAPLWSCVGRSDLGTPNARDAAFCDFLAGKSAGSVNLRAEFLDLWSAIARRYGDDRRIVGFDLLEEPPEIDCGGTSSTTLLLELYRDVRRRLGLHGARQALFFDPPVRPDASSPEVLPPPRIAAVFAPHFFSQAFGVPAGEAPQRALARSTTEAAARARKMGAVFFAGALGADLPLEQGFRPLSPAFATSALDALDEHLAGGTLFVAGGRRSLSSELGAILSAATRPFARRIAGIPTTMRFDRSTGSYQLVFGDDPTQRVADPTEIFVPRALYPHGFEASVLPSGRWRYDERSQRLLVYRGDASGHTVQITRRELAPLPP